MARRLAWIFAAMMCAFAANAKIYDLSCEGFEIVVESSPDKVDAALDFEVTVSMTVPSGLKAEIPDLQDRFRGFSVAEDFVEPPVEDRDGKTQYVSRWRLIPKVKAEKYRLAPFVVRYGTDEMDKSFYTTPVFFDPPEELPPVTGELEIAPEKVLPPFGWRWIMWAGCGLVGVAAVIWLVVFVVRKIAEMIKVRRMSPIQRALYELANLMRKGLPGRGFYKDFYVELTMVVRRYIERQHGIRAPHLTTWEFLRAAEDSRMFPKESIGELREFLESADLVKFAGVQSTPEMASDAADKATVYLKSDSAGKGVRK